MDKLFPTDRVVSDTCKVIYYYRPSPDRSRILFGGRVSADETNPAISGPQLHRDMCRIFPLNLRIMVTHILGQVPWPLLSTHMPTSGNMPVFIMQWDTAGLALAWQAILGFVLGNS